MNILSRLGRYTASLLLALTSLSAAAEQMTSDGTYEIHYNAFNSTFLQPDVARNYGLTRSKTLALINVSVLKKMPDGSKKPVEAQVTGTVANLIQQSEKLSFSPIKETNALYYIGSYRFADDQPMRINIQVKPDADKPAYEIRFEQKLRTE